MNRAKDLALKNHNVDLTKISYLASEDDTAIQPHIDLKVYSKERKI